MYLKYHKAGLTPTTPVTSIAISPVKMSIGRKSLTNLRSEMIFLQGKPVFLYLPTIYTPILTDNPQILLTMDTLSGSKAKVGLHGLLMFLFYLLDEGPSYGSWNDRKAEICRT
jgi:hypothetical protein